MASIRTPRSPIQSAVVEIGVLRGGSAAKVVRLRQRVRDEILVFVGVPLLEPHVERPVLVLPGRFQLDDAAPGGLWPQTCDGIRRVDVVGHRHAVDVGQVAIDMKRQIGLQLLGVPQGERLGSRVVYAVVQDADIGRRRRCKRRRSPPAIRIRIRRIVDDDVGQPECRDLWSHARCHDVLVSDAVRAPHDRTSIAARVPREPCAGPEVVVVVAGLRMDQFREPGYRCQVELVVVRVVLIVVTQPQVQRQVRPRAPIVLDVPLDPMTLQMPRERRERGGVLRGACEIRQAGGILRVEILIAPERPGADIVRLLFGRVEIQIRPAELPAVIAQIEREVIADVPAICPVVGPLVSAPGQTEEGINRRIACESLGRKLALPARGPLGQPGRRSQVFQVRRRDLRADFVQDPIADDPGMRHEQRVARRGCVGPAKPPRSAAAEFAERYFLVPDISREHVLQRVDLEIAPSEKGTPLVRGRKAAFDRRVELRLSGLDRRGFGFLGAFVRGEEVKTILQDRAAHREAVGIPAVLGFRVAELIVALFLQLVQRVEALVAEELERLAAEPVGPGLGGRQEHAADSPILRRRLIHVDLEFSNRGLGDLQELLPGVVDHVQSAIDVIHVVHVGRPASPDSRLGSAHRGRVQGGARQDERERGGLPIRNRQRVDLLAGHDCGHVSVGGLDHRSHAHDRQ